MERRAINVCYCKLAVIFGLFSPWVTITGDRAWEGQRDYKMGEGGREGEEEKSAVNDYRCNLAVCWTEFTLGLGFERC